MGKEWIISVVLVVAIIGADIGLEKITKQSMEGMYEKLQPIQAMALQAIDKPELQEELRTPIEEALAYWETKNKVLAYYIEHNELEKVKTQLYILKGNVEAADYRQAVATIENCCYVLEHLEEKTHLSWNNIF